MRKDEFDLILEKVRALHCINFGKDGIIQHAFFDENHFSFAEFINDDSHNTKPDEDPAFDSSEIIGYCELCNGEDTRANNMDSKYALCNVSHGSHSIDFLESYGWNMERIEQELLSPDWKDTPVLFLMENPSFDYGIYTFLDKDINHEGKRPAKKWYWIHRSYQGRLHEFEGKTFLRMGKYGEMVSSLIKQNKLANAYLTNVVKCGMSDAVYDETKHNKVSEEHCLGTDYYTDGCKKKCIENVLSEEISELVRGKERLIVFAFGGNAYWLVRDYLIGKRLMVNVQVIQLPHPAARLKDSYRAVLLSTMVKDAIDNPAYCRLAKGTLLKAGIIEKIKFRFGEMNLPVISVERGGKRRKDVLVLKTNIRESLFEKDSDEISEIWIRSDSKGVLLDGDYGFGYNCQDDSFWIWDYLNNKSVEHLDGKLADCFSTFKSAIEEVQP